MRIFITGATGFVGSNLISELAKVHEIGILVRAKSNITKKISDNINGKYVYDGTFNSINDAIGSFEPHIIIHLASYYVFDHKPEELDHLLESNIKVGTYILEAMKGNGVKYLINTGTSFEHFGSNQNSPVNLYASTKRAFGHLVKYYCDAGYIRAITLKLFDTYGENDNRRKLLNLLKENISNQKELKLSPGEQIIDMVHIKDVVNAYKIVLDQIDKYREPYLEFGLGSNERFTLKELARKVEEITGKQLNISWGARPYREREVMMPWQNYPQLPNWNPTISFETGLMLFFEKKIK